MFYDIIVCDLLTKSKCFANQITKSKCSILHKTFFFLDRSAIKNLPSAGAIIDIRH